jgi:hypothetical protein
MHRPHPALSHEWEREFEPDFEMDGWLATYPLIDADAKQALRRSLGDVAALSGDKR